MALWYIDNVASGTNAGTSWTNAWESFEDINWGSINPNDTLYISGGSVNKTYTGQMSITASGTFGNPITISIGQEAGHNGQAIIDAEYIENECIHMSAGSYIIISGEYNGNPNIKLINGGIYGFRSQGIATSIEIAYLEVTNNGTITAGSGIRFRGIGGGNNSIHHCEVHANYDDQISCSDEHNASSFGYMDIHHNHIYDIVDDGIITKSNGVRIYNNILHDKFAGDIGHPDWINCLDTRFLAVYNNIIYNVSNDYVGNSLIFLNPYGASYPECTDIYCYNNLIYEDIPTTENLVIGIVFGPTSSPPTSYENIFICNNTIIGTPTWGLTVNVGTISSANVNNVIVENNIIYNTGTYYEGSSRRTISIDGTVYQLQTLKKRTIHCGARKYTPEATMFFGEHYAPDYYHTAEHQHNGSPNSLTLGVCYCYIDPSGKPTDATYKSMCELLSVICLDNNLKYNGGIWRHFDVTGKKCPNYFVDNDNFVDLIHDVANNMWELERNV